MSAIVGAAALAPTLAAARTGATIALANKECLVAAGTVFLAEMRRSGATLLPVDSEHNAIFQLTCAERDCPIERLILTASGGPFRDRSRAEMAGVTVAQVQEATGFELLMATESIPDTSAPSVEQVRLIRKVIDPDGMRKHGFR